MKCMILVSEKLGSFPLAECGGIVLAAGDKLLVKAEIYERMKLQYGPVLLCVGEEEKESLRGGHYEYVPAGGKAVVDAAQTLSSVATKDAPAMAAKSSDKSVVGKFKGGRK